MPQKIITALAGGVGGARLVDGLAQILPAENLTVVVNIGDDFEHLGLRICPDLDTVCYTLAARANPATGWGLAQETYHALESLGELGGPSWFRLGDRDLGTHLERTRRLRDGQPLSSIVRDFCITWGIIHTVLPVSDDAVPTRVYTDEGELAFQDYFVRRQCHPKVAGFDFQGAEQASVAPGVLEAIDRSDWIIFCPSNPWVSLDPILAIPGISQAIAAKPVLAVSPIIGGQTVKGPAAKMYQELGINPSATAVANHYFDLIDVFVLDERDHHLAAGIEQSGLRVLITDTLMPNRAERRRLAEEILVCLTQQG